MILRSAKVARPFLVKASQQSLSNFARRSLFTPTATRSADLVQQLYLKELQAYKVPQVKASDSEGHVQKFALPKAPATPEEASLADGLKEYETQQPDIEGAAVAGEAAVEDWFVEEEEDEGHH